MKLSPYPKYKKSNLPWLDKIPTTWDIYRNGRLFSQRNETGYPKLPVLEVSLKTGVRVRDFDNSKRKQTMADFDKYKRAKERDIAYNMMRMWQGAVGVAPEDGLVSPAYVVASPRSQAVSEYYAFLFRTTAYMNEVNKYSHGIVSDRNRLYWDEFKQMPSVVPPVEEQKKIVAFLNAVKYKVQRFIRNKQRLIELYNEKIELLSFGGRKSNLHDWKTLFPEHWEFSKAKKVFTESSIKKNKDKQLLAVTQDRGVLPKSHCTQKYVSPGGGVDGLKLVQKNDFVISLRAFQGGIEFSPYEGIVSPAYNVFALKKELFSYEHLIFYRCLFKTKNFISLLNTIISGIRDGKNISFADFSEIELPIPPINELNELVQSFNSIEIARNSFKNERALIEEYQTRLISDVITGKLDVRDVTTPVVDGTKEFVKSDTGYEF